MRFIVVVGFGDLTGCSHPNAGIGNPGLSLIVRSTAGKPAVNATDTEFLPPGLLIEPYAYLRTVFTELPQATSVEQIEALLPRRMTANTRLKYHERSAVVGEPAFNTTDTPNVTAILA